MPLIGKQNMQNLAFLALTIETSALSALPAQAAIFQFTDRAIWEAAVAGHLTEDFNAIAPFKLPNTTTTSVGLLNIETVVPNGSTGFTRVTSGTSTSPKNIDGTNFLNLQLDGTPKSTIAFEFSEPTLAWGMDYAFTGFGDATELSFADFTTTFGGPNQSGFIGFISDTSFKRVNFKDPSASFAAVGLDNVSFAQNIAAEQTTVPEPSAVLGSIVVLTIGGIVRCQRASSTNP